LASLICAGLYLRYTPKIYSSVAKIQIFDQTKELDLASDALSPLAMYSKVNLNNEIEVIKSYRLLKQVVDELDLDVSYYDDGAIKTTEIWAAPFVMAKKIGADSLVNEIVYKLDFDDEKLLVSDQDGNDYEIDLNAPKTLGSKLPFTFELRKGAKLADYKNIDFKVIFWPKKEAVLGLMNSLSVEPTNKKAEILSLSLSGESQERSEDILNVIIDKFNKDGILDRQLVSKRTLGFIDERFIYLSGELDSIESGKQDFKQANNLSYLDEDITYTLRKKSIADEEVSGLRTQLSLSRLLKKTILEESRYSLLPSDIGLENSSINILVSNYNELALQRSKLLASVGDNHPSLVSLNGQLDRGRQNILKTVDVYQKQLNVSLGRYYQDQNIAGSDFSDLPEKEKMLRSIERQQNIKENLFVLLLTKREEAAINYAVTSPSIKVIDYGQTGLNAVSPKKVIVFPLFIQFTLDTKIHIRSDVVENDPEIPVIGEIPFIAGETNIIKEEDRSAFAESFRILAANLKHRISNKGDNEGKVIYVTSAVDGEGKTFTALNLSLAFSGLNKRVLLVGCDLRNPKLHKYFQIDKSVLGVSDFLNKHSVEWSDCIQSGFIENDMHSVCFSGKIPSNPSQLLADSRYEEFINNAKKHFDYVIVDTAPTILVTDTLLISEYADFTLFVLKAGFTEKRTLEYVKALNKNRTFSNISYVINNVGEGTHKNYNYGYGYGYGEYSPKLSKIKKVFDKIKFL